MKVNKEKLNKVIVILPGLIVCIIIAWIGKFIGNYIPSIGEASLAIFIGMAFGNTYGNKKYMIRELNLLKVIFYLIL